MKVARFALGVVGGLGGLAGLAAAQEVTAAWPWTASEAIVAEPGMIYAGFGSGVLVLSPSVTDVQLFTPAPANGNRVDAGGFVADLALTSTHLYAAAGRAGLVRFVRSTMAKNISLPLAPSGTTEFARTIAVVTVGTDEYAILGTDDLNGGGKVWIVNTTNQTVPLVSFSLGVPVYAVAASAQGSTLTLLVGTACAGAAPNHTGLLRYDLDPTQVPSNPTPTATWAVTVQGSLKPTFVRDIVLDNGTLDGTPRAYVACYIHGVFRFNITSGLTLESSVTFAKPSEMPRLRYNGLALDTVHDMLVVVHGPKLQGETQFWGPAPIPCDGNGSFDSVLVSPGLTLYEVGSTSATLVGHLKEGDGAGQFDGAPAAAAICATSSNQAHIAVANNTQGYSAVVATDQGSTWEAGITTAFDQADGQPTGAHDDVDFLPGASGGAYVSTENALSTLTHSSGATLLNKQDLDSMGVVLAIVSESYIGDAPMIYASSQPGISFVELGIHPLNPVPGVSGGQLDILDTGGKAFDMAVGYQLPGYPPNNNPPRWLFMVNAGDCLTTADCDSAVRVTPTSGGLRVYEVGDALVPDESMLVGAAYEGMEDQLGVDLTGAFIGVTIRANPNTYDAWILYNKNLEPADEVGVIHVEVSRGPGSEVHMAPAGRYPVPNATSWDTNQGTVVGRVRYVNGKLYAGLGAAGVGVFDVATNTWTYRHLPNMIVLAALPGSNGEVYFTTLRTFVGILPEASLSTATPILVPTRYQTIMMRAEPTDPDILWLPQGHGGVERVDLSGF